VSRICTGLTILIFFVTITDSALAQSHCCPRCVTSYVTERNFRAGHHDFDLRVRIVGRKQSTIEAYFNSHFARFVLPTSDAILCPSVMFSKPSTEGYHGTFAVRYYTGGIHGLALCGWKGSSLKTLYPGGEVFRKGEDGDGNEIDVKVPFEIDQSHHFRLEWMTNQICRIQHGHHQKQLTIVRFDSGADDPQWRLVYAGPLSGE